jgi:hypothetical protein
VLALVVFGMHASVRFWLPGVLGRLFGEVPELAQAPPAMIMLLGGYVLLSFIGGVCIAGCIGEGQLARDRARWAREAEVCRQLWELEQQIREEGLPDEERRWHAQYRQRQAAIQREARRRLGLPEEGDTR